MKKYDLHIHSHFSSCSNMRPSKILRIAKKRKLNGIAITDHNTIKGGLEAKKLNKDKNFEVIIGAEIKTKAGEIIGYYLKREIKEREPLKVIKEIHKQGGIAVIAHPFGHGIIRKCAKVDLKELKNLDGVEVHNSRNTFHWENFYALVAARKYKLAETGGSDAHFYYEIGKGYTLFKGSLKKAIRNKTTKGDGRIAPLPWARGMSMLRKIGVKYLFHKR
ncbi:PHP domain-containing protein [Candidatus Woesearchaeota archaeon]|nr:PHP domain-containing protein [Candidatus Woesearchaeota archaeon]